MDVVVTDFGPVLVSARSLAWLDALDKEWRTISSSKKKRGKHAAWVCQQVQRFEVAVMVAAAIAWNDNNAIQEF